MKQLVVIRKMLINLKRLLFPVDYLEKLRARGLIIGKNLNIQQGVIIDDSHCWHITLGDNVTLAPNVHILAHDASTKIFLGYTRIGKVNIGNNVFIGASSIILPGVQIGDNVVIGAGTIVNRDVASNSVAVGNPMQIVSNIDTFIDKKKEEMKECPVFDASYTLGQNVTKINQKKMNEMMTNRFGYII